jgi:hypothetical protein
MAFFGRDLPLPPSLARISALIVDVREPKSRAQFQPFVHSLNVGLSDPSSRSPKMVASINRGRRAGRLMRFRVGEKLIAYSLAL